MQPFFRLSDNFEKLHKRCKWHLLAYGTTRHPEHLHKLRVTIKRINALFRLANAASKKFDYDRYYKPYRMLFKAAGKIREVQVHIENLQLLTGKKRNTETEQLKSEIKKMNKTFISMQNEFVALIDKNSKRVAKKFTHIKQKQLQKSFEADQLKIHEQVFTIRQADKLHSFRKKLKRLMYNSELADKKIPVVTKNYLKAIDHLQDTIGKWHDAELLKQMAQPKENLHAQLPAIEKQCDKLLMEIERQLNLFKRKLA